MTAARWIGAAGATVVLLAACSTDPWVATESAEPLAQPQPTTVEPTPPATHPPATTPLPTDPPDTDAPATGPPDTDVPVTADPAADVPAGTLGDRLDIGDAKPQRDYDEFVRLALNDIERWWSIQYPIIYGGPFEPLAGGVFAGYPERTTPIPGCETDEPTPYEDIREFSAFYCRRGDFIVYDDGAEGVLGQLAAEFDPSILGVVFSHEYGHAIQSRSGVLDLELATITSEQQADCFAGAWVSHARSGEAEGITFTDAEVRNGLIAMITVRDPIGIDQFEPGGHGSAFDRVGAFQTGFTEGPARCAELIDDPLPLVPNTFRTASDDYDGNAEYAEILDFIPGDLQEYWDSVLADLGVTMPTLTLTVVQSPDGVRCDEPAGSMRTGAVYCPATQQVFLDETFARDLYGEFGDFVVGYTLGGAWSEAAQTALGSTLTGEARFLVDDCLTGAWAATAIPAEDGTTARGTAVEPGDLDEAIQTALVVGDDATSDDVIGTGFEKIAGFREGVLDGLEACTAKIGD